MDPMGYNPDIYVCIYKNWIFYKYTINTITS